MAALDRQDRDEAREREIDEYLEMVWADAARHPSLLMPVGNEYMSAVMMDVDADHKGLLMDYCIAATTPLGRDTVEGEFERWMETARKAWSKRPAVRAWAAEEMRINEPEDDR